MNALKYKPKDFASSARKGTKWNYVSLNFTDEELEQLNTSSRRLGVKRTALVKRCLQDAGVISTKGNA